MSRAVRTHQTVRTSKRRKRRAPAAWRFIPYISISEFGFDFSSAHSAPLRAPLRPRVLPRRAALTRLCQPTSHTVHSLQTDLRNGDWVARGARPSGPQQRRVRGEREKIPRVPDASCRGGRDARAPARTSTRSPRDHFGVRVQTMRTRKRRERRAPGRGKFVASSAVKITPANTTESGRGR